MDDAGLRAEPAAELADGERLQDDDARRRIEDPSRDAAPMDVAVHVGARERHDERRRAVTRLDAERCGAALARVERDHEVRSRAAGRVADGDAVSEASQDARPAERGHAIPLSRARTRGAEDEYGHAGPLCYGSRP